MMSDSLVDMMLKTITFQSLQIVYPGVLYDIAQFLDQLPSLEMWLCSHGKKSDLFFKSHL